MSISGIYVMSLDRCHIEREEMRNEHKFKTNLLCSFVVHFFSTFSHLRIFLFIYFLTFLGERKF